MRADERQAAVAYAYAWWMTADDDAAADVLRAAMATPDPAEDSDEARLVALTGAVRDRLGDLRPMPPASELALLHDGYGVPLQAAASLAGVPPGQAADHLASGRLDALLETVRDDFRHSERLGGLATEDPSDLEHALECRSCARARTLLERGAQELKDVSPVSAPPGLIPGLVAQYAPPAPAETSEPAAEEPTGDDAVSVHEIFDEPGDYAVAGDAPPGIHEAEEDDAAAPPAPPVPPTPSVEELEEMLQRDAPAERPAVEDADAVEAELADEGALAVDTPVAAPEDAADAPPVELEPAEPEVEEPAGPEVEPDVVPTTPARRNAAAILAVAGVATAGALVAVLIASGDDPAPAPEPQRSEQVAVGNGETEPPSEERSEKRFGPNRPNRKGFSVSTVGLLLAGSNEMAPSGTTIDPDEPLRIAVDYRNATKGVELDVVWRVDDTLFRRLSAVVSARDSRHVWGVPVPAKGWPKGSHRVVVTADDSVAGAIDFTVR